MISYLIDLVVNFAVGTISFFGYVGVFILMLLESCGIPIPSEVIMPFSGFLIARGEMLFWIAVFAGTFGNLAGSLLAYWIGLRGGRPALEKYGRYLLIHSYDLNLADRWFNRYGQLTVFFGRLLPVVRTYISFPAGVARMNIKKFSAYTFFGSFLWSALFAWLGIMLGNSWEIIREKLHNFDLAIALLIVLAIALYIYRHIKHKHPKS